MICCDAIKNRKDFRKWKLEGVQINELRDVRLHCPPGPTAIAGRYSGEKFTSALFNSLLKILPPSPLCRPAIGRPHSDGRPAGQFHLIP
jgi:hypothetical protein